MGKGVWGIDVGKSSIKVARLEMQGGTPALTHLEVSRFDVPAEDATVLDEQVCSTLEELKETCRFGADPVVISLPGHSTFNRLIKLPPVDDEKIPEIVQYEAQSQIPFNIDEVFWDYQVIERDYEMGEEKEVLLFAIKRDIVELFLENIAPLGLNIEAVQFAPVALYNFLSYDQDLKGPTIALDVGGENTDLIILDGPKFWVRNLPITGSDITKTLQKTFNLPYAEAEKLKIRAGQSQQAQKIFNAIQPALRDLVSEIHRSVGYYKSISKIAKFDKVLLLGKGARVINFQRFVAQSLSTMGNIPVGRIQKLHKINTDRVDTGALNANLSTIGGSIGLALQGFDLTLNQINLLPPEFRKKKELKKKQPFIAAAVAILYLLLGIMYLTMSSEVSDLQAIQEEAKKANQKHLQLQGGLNHARQVGDKKAALDTLSSITFERDLLMKVLDRINDCIPANGLLKADGSPALNDNERLWIVDWTARQVAIRDEAKKKKPAKRPKRGELPPLSTRNNLEVVMELCIFKRDTKVNGSLFIESILKIENKNLEIDGFALPQGLDKGYGWSIDPDKGTLYKPLPSSVSSRLGGGAEEDLEEDEEAGSNFWQYRLNLVIPMGREVRTRLAEKDEETETSKK
jgi:type IV pilus assembly protein PilM